FSVADNLSRKRPGLRAGPFWIVSHYSYWRYASWHEIALNGPATSSLTATEPKFLIFTSYYP
ncbi:hypothetical protein ABH309_19510, partial [Chromobacterium piscinae]